MRAGRDRRGEFIGSGPEAFTWKKDVFDAGADHLLEVGVSEAVRLNGADVFAGHVPGAKPSIAWRWEYLAETFSRELPYERTGSWNGT